MGFMAPVVMSYTTPSLNTPKDIVWLTEDACDLKVWKTAGGCKGVDRPWAFGTLTDSTASAGGNTGLVGNVRAWHFLADKNKGVDPLKVWSIEKGDTIQALLYLYQDYKDNGSGAWANTGTKSWTVGTAII